MIHQREGGGRIIFTRKVGTTECDPAERRRGGIEEHGCHGGENGLMRGVARVDGEIDSRDVTRGLAQ